MRMTRRRFGYDRRDEGRARIFCPQCEWRPCAEDRCGIKWPKTQCHQCGVLSPHEHWYHYPSVTDRDTSDADNIGATA
jgi:hypothetical protein